ncbi:NUDIX domain-containing protein [Leptotrichia sp. oral taxon 223]|uniref:NUDIX domain-containing protein n=1 Tax=Leptotrichia sp. oral taxon 223 TaxID=712363 RepID=UPI0015BB943F|nr:NUDIX domain-containing protein [Leptotrichia sp. oral taxon 223]NWO18025.1 NUDIX domain-containing protein [Leptotrichia sp. oral taxon 223]
MENVNFLKKHLQNLAEYEPELKTKIEKILEILSQMKIEDLTNRKSKVHLSASAVVFNKNKCYFIKHPYLKTILLPAGHVENDEIPLDTAIREFVEETGFFAKIDENMKNMGLIDVNAIDIPKNPVKSEGEHIHIDFRYKLVLDEDREGQKAELEWFLLGENEVDEEFKGYYKYLKK